MRFADWYTDTADVFRTVSTVVDGITRNSREQIYTAIPCRVYQPGKRSISMSRQAAKVQQENKIALDNAWVLKAGDELLIRRGARLGKEVATIRAFAGVPVNYFEPVGAVVSGIAHQEVTLLQEERVK